MMLYNNELWVTTDIWSVMFDLEHLNINLLLLPLLCFGLLDF